MSVRQDTVSIAFSVLSVMLLIFLSTFGQDLMVRSSFAVILILAGFSLSRITGNLEFDDDVDTSEGFNIVTWVVVSLGVIVMLTFLVPKIPLSINNLSATEMFLVPKMFGMLIAISEENFFRGFATNFFISKLKLGLGIIVSGVFFGIYHLAVYSTDSSLMIYVVGAGLILSYVAVVTGRTSTTMIAHVIVNFVAG